MRIGVDVDLTVVNSDWAWKFYIEENVGKLPVVDGKLPYGLHTLYPEEHHEAIMNFWDFRDIYDHLDPMLGCVDVIHQWKAKGYEIVFISTIKGDHHKSKFEFIKRNFPFDGVIYTREKGYVDVDVMIDDRESILASFDPQKTCLIRMESNYEQDHDTVSHFVAKDWTDERLIKL